MKPTESEVETMRRLAVPAWQEFATPQAKRCYRPAMALELSLRRLMIDMDRRRYLEGLRPAAPECSTVSPPRSR